MANLVTGPLGINADQITSRRTNTSGRALLALSFTTIMSFLFRWDFSALWGLSENVGISQSELNLAVFIILLFLLFAHTINWYSDFTHTSINLLKPLKERVRLTDIDVAKADEEMNSAQKRGQISASDIVKEKLALNDRESNLKLFASVHLKSTFGVHLQLWGLHFIPPVTAGLIALGFLAKAIWQ